MPKPYPNLALALAHEQLSEKPTAEFWAYQARVGSPAWTALVQASNDGDAGATRRFDAAVEYNVNLSRPFDDVEGLDLEKELTDNLDKINKEIAEIHRIAAAEGIEPESLRYRDGTLVLSGSILAKALTLQAMITLRQEK